MSRAPNRAGVRVEAVTPGSPAQRAGLEPGDRIVSVSGRPVEDLLDLHFRTAASSFRMRWRTPSGEEREARLRGDGPPLGIHPEPIRVRRCRNRCVFCFVHQLPKGLRKSLYVKDEDIRLSFLHGQYVTFSDVTEGEIRKILRFRLSPLYVSIHTTDPGLRRRMLGNPRAADVMRVMRRLLRGGIALHGQVVVCPGWNDGEELLRTLRELAALRPGLANVAVVPVGLTAHRAGLPPLRPVGRAQARETLGALASLNRELGRGAGEEPFAQAADEYLLLAGERIPGRRTYGSFSQIGNGVGLLRQFLDGSRSLFRRAGWPRLGTGGTVASGMAPRAYVAPFLEEFSRRTGVRFRHLPVRNRFLGESVTVTGLLSGGDLLDALKGHPPAGRILVPSVCLREAQDLFLDGVSPGDIARETGVPVVLFDPSPAGFLRAVREGNS